MVVTIDTKKNEITIILPISPRPSASGKTTVIASSAGNKPTTAVYDDKVVIVGCNCYIAK